MEEIYDAVDTFPFDKLILTKPIQVAGGNYFSRCLINNTPLYIQPPKCTTKQGILKAGKRFYTDLMFTNENEALIRWMENLENHCQQYIFKNRERWFEGDLELHDVENYFTSPLKIYKSGKYYIARTNISSVLGKPSLKIYDENENELEYESITDKTNIMTILEIQGIKCSARSFQIEIEVKQMMVLKPSNLFDKCIIKAAAVTTKPSIQEQDPSLDQDEYPVIQIQTTTDTDVNIIDNMNPEISIDAGVDITPSPCSAPEGGGLNLQRCNNLEESLVIETAEDKHLENNEETNNIPEYDSVGSIEGKNDDNEIEDFSQLSSIKIVDGMEEVEFHLDELPEETDIQLKKRDDVYYEMYREARRKARIARDLALASYLEAKRIKNTYMLEDDIEDSENDSDDEEVFSKIDKDI